MQRGQLKEVPLDTSEKTYASMLRTVGEEAELGQLEDAPQQANPQANWQIVMHFDEDFDPPPAPKRRAGNRAGAKQKAKRDWVNLMCPGLHDGETGELWQGQAVGQPPEMLPLADAPPVAAGAASSASNEQQGRPSQPGQQGRAGQRRKKDLANETDTYVEGVKVKVNRHGNIGQGQPGFYERVLATCPKCKVLRQRSFSANLENGLGELEPYAYVGAWLRRCSDFASPDEHKAYKPSPAEVQEYAETVLK